MASGHSDSALNQTVAFYDQLMSYLDYGRSAGLLLLRLYIGYECVVSGWAHLHHIPDTTDFFASMHIPFPKANVILSALTEIAAGALVLVGLISRPASAALVGNFIVALFAFEFSKFDFSFSELAHGIWNNFGVIFDDTAFPILAAAVIILFFGPGLISADALLRHLLVKKVSPKANPPTN